MGIPTHFVVTVCGNSRFRAREKVVKLVMKKTQLLLGFAII